MRFREYSEGDQCLRRENAAKLPHSSADDVRQFFVLTYSDDCDEIVLTGHGEDLIDAWNLGELFSKLVNQTRFRLDQDQRMDAAHPLLLIATELYRVNESAAPEFDLLFFDGLLDTEAPRHPVAAVARDLLPLWRVGLWQARASLENGDNVVVYLHARVRLKDSTEWIGGRFADGFVFRDGKISEYLTFA